MIKPKHSTEPGTGHPSISGMPTYLVSSLPTQSDEPVPKLIITAEHMDALPTDIRAYDPADEQAVEHAERMMRDIAENPDETSSPFILGRIAVSYGAIRELTD